MFTVVPIKLPELTVLAVTELAVTPPFTIRLPMLRLPEKSKVLTYKAPQRWAGLPKFLILEALGKTSTLAMTRPMPLGAKTKLPLVSKVRMVLLDMAMLLPTGPAAKI